MSREKARFLRHADEFKSAQTIRERMEIVRRARAEDGLDRELVQREATIRNGVSPETVACGECGEKFLCRDVEHLKECPACGAKRTRRSDLSC